MVGAAGCERSDDQQGSHAPEEPPPQPHIASGGYHAPARIAKDPRLRRRLTATGEAK